mgnify:FL=1
MNRKMKKKLYKIIISGILFLIALLLKIENEVINNILFIISYIIVGKEILEKAFKNITRGKVFDENFLMTVATLGAFLIGEYPEAVAVMLFYQIGELFQSYAVDKSRKSVAALMDIRPDYANLLDDGKEIKVNPEKVNIGDVIIIKPGEKIPIDGVVIEGNTSLNTFALTGETVPREVRKKDEVLSGSINNEGLIKVKTTKKFSDSTVSKILDLVENASSKKSNSENFISKFAKYYTPIVVVIALTLCIFPPIILNQKFTTWIYRGLSFLVVSCPCALVVSIPLSFFGGIGASSKIGVLIKGSNYLESLSKTETIICDKTGTLTEGVFEVQKIEPVDISEKELLKYAAYTEHFSNHPISMSLKKAYGKKIDSSKVTNTKEISGKGVIATIDNKEIIVGNEKILKDENIKYVKSEEVGTIIYIAIDKKFAGTIVISDKIKKDAKKAIRLFRKNNVKKIVMLTGDKENISKEVFDELKLDDYKAELLPQDKVEIVEQIIKEKTESKQVAFIGDGINDAPVLALSDIGIAMGGAGSDAAIEAADIVIMTDEPSKLADAMKISKKTMKIVKENIIFAITVKIVVLLLSALGLATMWAAVFADVGVSVIAILNALRILRVKNTYTK